MKTENEIKNRLVSIRRWRDEAKERMEKEEHMKWVTVINYLKWVLGEPA